MLDEYRAIAELDDLKAKALRYNTAAYGRDFPSASSSRVFSILPS